MEVESIRIEHGRFVATVSIHTDDDCENPNNWDSHQVVRCESAHQLEREMVPVFGITWRAAVDKLANGEVVRRGGMAYVGIEEYRHGASAFALCSRRGNFPDRMWDVIPFVGWCSLDKGNLTAEEWKDDEKLFDIASSTLSHWSDWANGYCYGWMVEVTEHHPDDSEWERERADLTDGTWGYIGDLDYVKEEAMVGAETALRGATGEDVELGKWEDHE